MANFTAADVKKLREPTGAGMMDCKKALDEADGDFDKAVEILRVKGQKGVAKREGRTAANGLVAAHRRRRPVGALVELNCETDFVAKGEQFMRWPPQSLAQAVAVQARPTPRRCSPSAARAARPSQALLDEANAIIGEKIELGRVARCRRRHVVVVPAPDQPRPAAAVGVLVELDRRDAEAARDVASTSPRCARRT